MKKSSIELEELQDKVNYIEKLNMLEVEFQMYGYNAESIKEIKHLNGAKSAKEQAENLESEKEYWSK